MLNLFAQDLAISNFKEQVVQVVKYYRNNHFCCCNIQSKRRLRKPIPVALHLMHRDSCTIGDSVMILKNLQKELTSKLSQDAKKKLSKRIEQAMTPAHFLANIVNLKYRGKDLTDNEIEIGMGFAASKNPDFLPL